MLGCVFVAVSTVGAVRVIRSGDPETTLFVATALVLVCAYGTAAIILLVPRSSTLAGAVCLAVAVVWLARGTGPLRGTPGVDMSAVAHPLIWSLLVVLLVVQRRTRPLTRADHALLAVNLATLPLLVLDSRIARPAPTDPCLVCLPAPDWTVEPYLPLAARLAVVVVAVWLAIRLIVRWRQRVWRIVALPGLLLCLQVAAAAVLGPLVMPPEPVWLVGNALGVILQILLPPLVVLSTARGWHADVEHWEHRYTQEAEHGRRRARIEIERDLHDGAQLRLINATLLLQMARNALAGAGPDAEAHLDTAASELTLAISELRLLSRGLRPPALTRRNLREALTTLAANIPVTVRIEGHPGTVSRPVAEVVYFTVAEALANAIRHGAASTVVIRMRKSDDCLHLEIRDNGTGTAQILTGSGGLGHLGRRAEELGGRFSVDSRPGAGTTLRVVIPCELSLQTTRR